MLAKLHRVTPETQGLGDYGRPGNYYTRQISRWSRQYEASKTESIDAMDKLMAWLPGAYAGHGRGPHRPRGLPPR